MSRKKAAVSDTSFEPDWDVWALEANVGFFVRAKAVCFQGRRGGWWRPLQGQRRWSLKSLIRSLKTGKAALKSESACGPRRFGA